MLYVGCCWCRSIVTLVCAGQSMPHMAVPVEQTVYGPACAYCGVLPPVFTCGNCYTAQWLIVQGAGVPQGYQWGQPSAPVVQAPANASHSQVSDLLGKFAEGAGQQFVQWITS